MSWRPQQLQDRVLMISQWGWQAFSVKGQKINKYALHPNYSLLLLQGGSSHRLYLKEWMCLCFNKTLFTQTEGGLDLSRKWQTANPGL